VSTGEGALDAVGVSTEAFADGIGLEAAHRRRRTLDLERRRLQLAFHWKRRNGDQSTGSHWRLAALCWRRRTAADLLVVGHSCRLRTGVPGGCALELITAGCRSLEAAGHWSTPVADNWGTEIPWSTGWTVSTGSCTGDGRTGSY
jgi:hypothetical protein